MIFDLTEIKKNSVQFAMGDAYIDGNQQFYDIGFKPDFLFIARYVTSGNGNYINSLYSAMYDADVSATQYKVTYSGSLSKINVSLGATNNNNKYITIGRTNGDSFTDKGFYAKITRAGMKYIALKRY